MPEKQNQGTLRVVEDEGFASDSTLEAFPLLFVSEHFFKLAILYSPLVTSSVES